MTARVIQGDARTLPFADGTADLVVTSPPYWSLRDYRDHGGSLAGQIGAEPTWQEYVDALVECTAEWARVLKPSGSMFVILGDKYSDRGHGPNRGRGTGRGPQATGLQQSRGPLEKSLLCLPWRYALACMDTLGLTIRAEIIWEKANPLPESVRDRVRRSHETILHLVKDRHYYEAVDVIREPHEMRPQRRPGGRPADTTPRQGQPRQSWSTAQRDEMGPDGHPLGRLPSSVWRIPTFPLLVPAHIEHAHCCGGPPRSGCTDGLDHHAAFPPDLVRKIILGWSPPGICTACGQGRFPVVAKPGLLGGDNSPESRNGLRRWSTMDGGQVNWARRMEQPDHLAGWACACTPHPGHPTREYHLEAWPPPPTRAAVVVDPFGGTGTTALVADLLGRDGYAVELSAGYCGLARWRTTDPGERARAAGLPKPPPVPDGMQALFDLDEIA